MKPQNALHKWCAPELIFDFVFFIYSDTACEQTLASLESKKEDFERYKTRLAVVRKEKEKRKLELIGKGCFPVARFLHVRTRT